MPLESFLTGDSSLTHVNCFFGMTLCIHHSRIIDTFNHVYIRHSVHVLTRVFFLKDRPRVLTLREILESHKQGDFILGHRTTTEPSEFLNKLVTVVLLS